MLARSAEPANRFTRRDAGRLIAASVLLIVAMSVILGLDFLPAQTQLEVGKPAPANVQAPRADQYVSEVLTERERAGRPGRGGAPVRLHDRPRRVGGRPAAARASSARWPRSTPPSPRA